MKKSLGNVLIFGDSYSTYDNYCPDGFSIYYHSDKSVGEVPRFEDGGGVSSVNLTWWMMLLNETASHLVMNNSWSGSALGLTGYGGYNPNSAMVTRMPLCYKDGKVNGEKIDTVIIFGGTNDSWSGAPVGTPKYEKITHDDLCTFLPAFSYMIDYCKNAGARVITICNDDVKPEFKDGMKEVSEHYGVEFVQLYDLENVKVGGHPTEDGMRKITDRILEVIE